MFRIRFGFNADPDPSPKGYFILFSIFLSKREEKFTECQYDQTIGTSTSKGWGNLAVNVLNSIFSISWFHWSGPAGRSLTEGCSYSFSKTLTTLSWRNTSRILSQTGSFLRTSSKTVLVGIGRAAHTCLFMLITWKMGECGPPHPPSRFIASRLDLL